MDKRILKLRREIDSIDEEIIQLLKKRMQTEGIFNEMRERTHYVAKSEKRRLAKAAGRRRWLKKQSEKENKEG